MPPSTTIEEAGRRAGRGLWISAHAFEAAGRAAPLLDAAAERTWMALASRRHGGHVERWRELLPALGHLPAEALVQGPAVALEAWWAATAGPEASPAALVEVHDVLARGALDVASRWAAAASPVVDGPERRVLGLVASDLRALVGSCPARLVGPPGAAAATLEAAGGLLGGLAPGS